MQDSSCSPPSTTIGGATGGVMSGNGEKTTMQLLQEMQIALENLDPETKRAYETARAAVPHLVLQETPLLHFLRTDGCRPAAAARRLATYWKWRLELFDDRWLLPMSLTGSGALTALDLELLKTDYTSTYAIGDQNVTSVDSNNNNNNNNNSHNNGNSNHGSSSATTATDFLLVADYGKLAPMAKLATEQGWSLYRLVDRVAFYFATVATTPFLQSVGATLIHIVTTSHNASGRPVLELRQTQWEMIKHALPVKIRRTIVARTVPEPNREALLDFLGFQTQKVLEYNSQPCAAVIQTVRANSVAALRQKMLAVLGVTSLDFVPTVLGGRLDLQGLMAAWRSSTHCREFVMQQQPRQGIANTNGNCCWMMNFIMNSMNGSNNNSTNNNGGSGDGGTAMLPWMGAATTSNNHHQHHDQHSTVLVVASGHNNNNNNNNNNRGTKRKKVAIEQEPNESHQDFVRRRNAAYQRDSYHRRLGQIVSLDKQVEATKLQGERARAEHRRLLSLLEQARQLVRQHEQEEEQQPQKQQQQLQEQKDVV